MPRRRNRSAVILLPRAHLNYTTNWLKSKEAQCAVLELLSICTSDKRTLRLQAMRSEAGVLQSSAPQAAMYPKEETALLNDTGVVQIAGV